MKHSFRRNSILSARIFLAADKPPTGNAEPLTIEAQLTAAQNELTIAVGATAAARNELATRTTEMATVRGELATRTTELTTARADLAARDLSLSTATADLATARTESATRASRITLLESALGAAGLDITALVKVPVTGTPASPDSKTRTALEFAAMSNAEKSRFSVNGGRVVG